MRSSSTGGGRQVAHPTFAPDPIAKDPPMNRRDSLRLLAGTAAFAAAGIFKSPALAQDAADGPFNLPPLGYAFEALEPHIDAQTMMIHHDKHHAAYVAACNNFAKQVPELGT